MSDVVRLQTIAEQQQNDVVSVLEAELLHCRATAPRFVIVMTVDRDGNVDWSYNGSRNREDRVRLLGYVELLRQKVLDRLRDPDGV